MGRCEAGLAVQDGLGDGQRRFDAGQVVGAVQGEIRTRSHLEVGHLVGDDVVLGPHDREHAGGDVAGAVVHHAGPVQDAAVVGGAEGGGQFLDARRWSVHPAGADLQAGGVGQRGHLDHRLGPVDEAAQHLRVHVLAVGLRGQFLGRGMGIQRIVLTLAGADHLEGQIAGEVDQALRFGRFVAAAHAVDASGLLGDRGQQVADGDVAFDIEQGDVLAGEQTAERHLRSDLGDTGRVDHDVDRQCGQQRGVLDGDGATGFDGLCEFCYLAAGLGVGAGLAQRVGGPPGHDVGNGGDLHAGDTTHLGDEAQTHLPGADQADADGPAQFVLAGDETFGVTHGNSLRGWSRRWVFGSPHGMCCRAPISAG